MMKGFWMTLSVGLLLSACGGKGGVLKNVQQKQVGDYTVTVLSESGTLKNGANDFTLEFRKTTDNQLADVGKVEVSPVMEMAGMAPMMGSAEVRSTSMPGRYEVKGNLTMAGLWKVNIKFSDQSVRFSLNAQ